MKKSIYLITSIFSMLLFLFFFDTYDNINQLNAQGLRIYEKAPNLYWFGNFFDIQNREEKDEAVQNLMQFAEENDVELSSSSSYTDEYMREVNVEYLYTKEKSILKGVKFEKDKTDLDFTSANNLYYSNSDTDTSAYDHMSYLNRFYRDNDSKTILRYYPFAQITKSRDVNFGVTFYSDNPKECLQKLKNSPLGKYVNEASISFVSAEEEGRIETDYSNQYQMIMILAGVSLIAVILQTIYRKRHQIGVYKQFGIPTSRICRNLFLKVMIVNSILYFFFQMLMFYLFCGVLIPESIALLRKLILCYLGVLGLFIISYLIAYGFIKKLTIVTTLKIRKKKTEVFYTVSYAIKFCMIIFIATSFLVISSQTVTDVKVLWNYKTREKEMSQYYQLYEYSITTEKEVNDLYEIYEIGNHYGALLAEFATGEDSVSPDMMPIDTDNFYLKSTVLANDNYLSHYSFLNEKGNVIDVEGYDEDICLIPIASKSKMRLYYGRQLPKEQVYYTNAVRLYSYNYPAIPMYEDNPIVIRTADATETENVNINLNTYVIPKSAYKSIMKELKEEGLENVVSFTDLKMILDTAMNGYVISLLQNILILAIYLLCMFCIVRESLVMYLHEYGQKIAMRYLHGWNFFKRSHELYLTTTVCYGFVLVLLTGVMKQDLWTAFYYTFACLLYDFMIMMISIKHSQKDMIKQCLKGDEWK